MEYIIRNLILVSCVSLVKTTKREGLVGLILLSLLKSSWILLIKLTHKEHHKKHSERKRGIVKYCSTIHVIIHPCIVEPAYLLFLYHSLTNLSHRHGELLNAVDRWCKKKVLKTKRLSTCCT